MVVVPKANGKMRICVDLTRLNESVKREQNPLPAFDQTLAQLVGATVFTMNANSRFWQIPPGSIIGSTDHLYNTFWSILLPPNALWDFISPRAFSAMNVRNLEWPCRCCVYDGRHSRPWQDTRGAQRKTGESTPMNARGWSDTEL